jgi:predicted AlkP superfamily pyrophosphatase or phosphodiesterase
MVYPNYQSGSIVNLVSSILSYYHIESDYAPLPNFVLPKHKRLVFMVIDGMGLDFLERHGKDSLFYKLMKQHLTSVFPSTTSAALTSLMTGVAPLQHALTGWFIYFKELATAGITLPFVPRFVGKSLDKLDVKIEDIFNFETIFKKIKNNMISFSPQETINSAFSEYCFGGKPKNGFKTV